MFSCYLHIRNRVFHEGNILFKLQDGERVFYLVCKRHQSKRDAIPKLCPSEEGSADQRRKICSWLPFGSTRCRTLIENTSAKPECCGKLETRCCRNRKVLSHTACFCPSAAQRIPQAPLPIASKVTKTLKAPFSAVLQSRNRLYPFPHMRRYPRRSPRLEVRTHCNCCCSLLVPAPQKVPRVLFVTTRLLIPDKRERTEAAFKSLYSQRFPQKNTPSLSSQSLLPGMLHRRVWEAKKRPWCLQAVGTDVPRSEAAVLYTARNRTKNTGCSVTRKPRGAVRSLGFPFHVRGSIVWRPELEVGQHSFGSRLFFVF